MRPPRPRPRRARARAADSADERRERDLAGRYLGVVVRLLPAAAPVGRAMQAELAALDGTAERWRFALGCTRAALLPRRAGRRRPEPSLAAAATAGLVLAGEVALAGVSASSSRSVLVLALLAWLGRRPSYFGPVRPERGAARARGRLRLVAACLLALVVAEGVPGLLRPDSLRWAPPFAARPDARDCRVPGHDRARPAWAATASLTGRRRPGSWRRSRVRRAPFEHIGTPLATASRPPAVGRRLLLPRRRPAASSPDEARCRIGPSWLASAPARLAALLIALARPQPRSSSCPIACPTSSGPSCPRRPRRAAAAGELRSRPPTPTSGCCCSAAAGCPAVGRGPATAARREPATALRTRSCMQAALPPPLRPPATRRGATASRPAALALVIAAHGGDRRPKQFSSRSPPKGRPPHESR